MDESGDVFISEGDVDALSHLLCEYRPLCIKHVMSRPSGIFVFSTF